MTADRWTQVVRHQLGLGRLLPLGLALDGAWITEEAAESVLRRETAAVEGVRLGALRIALADPDLAGTPAVPPPPSALPPGPLRVTAEFRASVDPTSPGAEPLPAVAARLRLTVVSAATRLLGLDVTEVDLRVTGLVEEADEADTAPTEHPADGERGAAVAVPADGVQERAAAPAPADGLREHPGGVSAAGSRDGADDVRTASVPKDPEEVRIAAAALAVPGVTRLTDVLGRPVHVGSVPAVEAALPRRHVRVELEVSGDERAVDVARAVRAAITQAAQDTPSVAVLVTAVSRGTASREA
ncbi:nucleopolyhedrovirus P10 family protein [Streptomyces sp. NBC_00151]|uniref:nucleopolyhedrovirus P10 family protein n=1 Tax=Streptomyces sp. NBC_00151 TaxID=2975669 RepID=UPI002DDBD728|nr:nucleopolyhedrovirus P10 family protein [Streptomyces sp. NBC_00151]WRZ42590.1 nucleopolyhedrovirus P10 family protein [Streptomyces sp. NBC_00151]